TQYSEPSANPSEEVRKRGRAPAASGAGYNSFAPPGLSQSAAPEGRQAVARWRQPLADGVPLAASCVPLARRLPNAHDTRLTFLALAGDVAFEELTDHGDVGQQVLRH